MNLVINRIPYVCSVSYEGMPNVWLASHKIITIKTHENLRIEGPTLSGVGQTLDEAIKQLILSIKREQNRIDPETQK